jgi:hypothetical protein
MRSNRLARLSDALYDRWLASAVEMSIFFLCMPMRPQDVTRMPRSWKGRALGSVNA